MFENCSSFFKGEGSLQVCKDGHTTERDIHIAVLALLVTISKVDNAFSKIELQKIFNTVCLEFSLEGAEAGSLLEITEFMTGENQGQLDTFLSAIREHFDPDQRMRVLGLVWNIIASDGKLNPEETVMAVEIRKKLDLTLEQAVRAQQLAQDGEYSPKPALRRSDEETAEE